MNRQLHRDEVILAVVLVLVNATAAAASSEISPQTANHLSNMYAHPWFLDVMGASVVGWVVGLVKGFAGTREWLAKYWSAPPKFAIFLFDLVVFVIAGAYFGVGIYNPDNFVASVAAGLSWPVGLGALATRN